MEGGGGGSGGVGVAVGVVLTVIESRSEKKVLAFQPNLTPTSVGLSVETRF